MIGSIAVVSLLGLGTESHAQSYAEAGNSFLRVRLVRAREIKGAQVISLHPNGQTTVTTTANVLALTYKHMVGEDVNGDSSSDGGTMTNPGVGAESLLEDPESPIGGPGGGSGGSGNQSFLYWLRIPSGGGYTTGARLGFLASPNNPVQIYDYVPMNYTSSNSGSPGTPIPGLRVKMSPGDEVTVCYSYPGLEILPSALVRVTVTRSQISYSPPPASTTSWTLLHEEAVYDLSRRDNFGDAAVDSRKGYGQPNREGQFPADPNAELRNINFGNWTYKGGMFIGNMPGSTNDRSGTARIQLNADLVPGGLVPRITVLTVYQAGKPTNVSGAMTLGVYGIWSGLGMPITAESALTWANKLPATPRAAVPNGQSYDPLKDPYRKFTLADSDGEGLLSTSLTKVWDVLDPESTGLYITKWQTPRLGALALALHDEQNLVDSGFTAWRYFSDKEFLPSLLQAGQLPPYQDLSPRIWNVYVPYSMSDLVLNSTNWGGY